MNVQEREWLAQRFEERRPRLEAIAYRMLGSFAEAEEAVQEAWLRLSGVEAEDLENLDGWLTTVVSRVSLNVLRARRVRTKAGWESRLPDPLVSIAEVEDPEHTLILSES